MKKKYKKLEKKYKEFREYQEKNKTDYIGQMVKLNEMWYLLSEIYTHKI